jgi:hypothetical protein
MALHLIALPIAITAWAAIFGIASTGRLSRLLPVGSRSAPTAAAVAAFAAVAGDILVLSLFGFQFALSPAKFDLFPLALAVTASLTRLVLARRAGYRCLSLRASLS